MTIFNSTYNYLTRKSKLKYKGFSVTLCSQYMPYMPLHFILVHFHNVSKSHTSFLTDKGTGKPQRSSITIMRPISTTGDRSR